MGNWRLAYYAYRRTSVPRHASVSAPFAPLSLFHPTSKQMVAEGHEEKQMRLMKQMAERVRKETTDQVRDGSEAPNE